MNDNRILYLDVARILAVASMVMLHAGSGTWMRLPVTSSGWQASNVYESMVRWCVPLFVMISGALFLRPDKDISLKRLYGKNVLRIVTAFVFWSVTYAVFTTWGPIQLSRPVSGVGAFIAECVRGHYHMWFLYMIAGLYMIVPFLKKITADKKLTEYFLLLAFVFAIVIPSLSAIPALADSLAVVAATKLNLHFVMGYSFYFVGGYYLHQNALSRRTKVGLYLLGAAGVLFTWFITNHLSVREGAAVTRWLEFLCPQTAMTTLAIFVLLRNTVSNIRFRDTTVRRILTVSKYSFGVYLVHVFFLYIADRIDHAATRDIHPAVTIPLYTVFVLACSYAASAVLHRIPVLNRFIV